MKPPVILVNMPWAMLRAPSLQLSTIKALLARHGIIASVLNLNLAWMKTLHEAGFSVADYIKVEAAAMAPGDWTFAIPPFRPASAAGVDDVAGYRDSIRGAYDDALFAALLRMRELVPGFVDACVERIVARAPRVVGFTSTFQQNVSSLLLAQALKQRLPDVITVFGGANCDGPMGAALHRSFDFIDVVVRGEAEPVAGQLFSELLMGKPISPQPGQPT